MLDFLSKINFVSEINFNLKLWSIAFDFKNGLCTQNYRLTYSYVQLIYI